MILTLFNIIYVLVAVAMTILILLQRGAGAQAGSGFGAGASGTVFGARGASNFLSRSTSILATLFFVLSLAMAWYLKSSGAVKPSDDLGLMGGTETPAAQKTPATAPTAPAPSTGDVPSAPATGTATPAAATDIPAAPAAAQNNATPAETKKDSPKKQ
jgi:preprotein translocase subunit SecG